MNKVSYPKLQELKSAHRNLMQEYIACIDRTSRLPFFLNCSRLLHAFEGETAFERGNRQMAFLFTSLTWRPFILYLVEIHIKSKLNELVMMYRKYALELPDTAHYVRHRNWLKTGIAECTELSDTLSTWKNAQTISATLIPILLSWVTSAFGAKNFSDLMQTIGLPSGFGFLFSIVLGLVFLPALILILLVNLAFIGKRVMFLPFFVTRKIDLAGYNIYVTENKLFDLLGHKKTPELAIDYITYASFIGVFTPFICLGTSYANLGAVMTLFFLIPMIMIAGMLIRFYNLRWD